MEFILQTYVEDNHAGDRLTGRYRSGMLVFMNSAPIYWLSKKQKSAETSSFGSEFFTMRICCEYLRGLRYKLCIMGIPVSNPVFLYGDKQSVLWNTTIPDSTLKKKSNSTAYQFVREGVVRDEWRTQYIKTYANLSKLMTKALPSGINRKRKVWAIMYETYPEEDNEWRRLGQMRTKLLRIVFFVFSIRLFQKSKCQTCLGWGEHGTLVITSTVTFQVTGRQITSVVTVQVTGRQITSTVTVQVTVIQEKRRREMKTQRQ